MNTIEVKDLTKTYFLGSVEVPALRGVSFRIERGEAVAIMGQSGSGKSTLMNVIGCLDLPTSGQYFLNGRNIAEVSDDELAGIRNQNIGFVFQQFNLLPRMTIRRNVEMPLLYAGKKDGNNGSAAGQRAEAMLNAVGLGDRLNHRPSELSGGQQQRVAIARALVNEPDLILADEPTGNLDSHTGAEIMSLLLKLNKEQNLTLVIVTHDPSIAASTQRIIRLRDGLIEDG
jgi:putative ABC transport system ATP-binding protein